MKNQFKRADKSSASLAIVLADDEIAAGTFTIKHLRHGSNANSEHPAQQTIMQNDVVNVVTNILESL